MILLQSAYKISQVKIKRRIIPVNPTFEERYLQPPIWKPPDFCVNRIVVTGGPRYDLR